MAFSFTHNNDPQSFESQNAAITFGLPESPTDTNPGFVVPFENTSGAVYSFDVVKVDAYGNEVERTALTTTQISIASGNYILSPGAIYKTGLITYSGGTNRVTGTNDTAGEITFQSSVDALLQANDILQIGIYGPFVLSGVSGIIGFTSDTLPSPDLSGSFEFTFQRIGQILVDLTANCLYRFEFITTDGTKFVSDIFGTFANNYANTFTAIQSGPFAFVKTAALDISYFGPDVMPFALPAIRNNHLKSFWLEATTTDAPTAFEALCIDLQGNTLATYDLDFNNLSIAGQKITCPDLRISTPLPGATIVVLKVTAGANIYFSEPLLTVEYHRLLATGTGFVLSDGNGNLIAFK